MASYRYLRWTITQRRSGGDLAVQAADFELLLDGSSVSWPVGSSATTSSGDVGSNVPGRLLDNTSSTKFYAGDFCAGDGATSGNTVVTIDATTAVSFNGYRYRTANDANNRDPTGWTLEGSANGSAWTTLDTRSGQTITTSRQTFTGSFSLPLEPITAGASATLSLTGAAAAKAPVIAAASSALALSSAAASKAVIAASAQGTLALAGAAETSVAIRCAAAATLTLSGQAAAQAALDGQGDATMALTGAAAGAASVRAQASAALALTASAAGRVADPGESDFAPHTARTRAVWRRSRLASVLRAPNAAAPAFRPSRRAAIIRQSRIAVVIAGT